MLTTSHDVKNHIFLRLASFSKKNSICFQEIVRGYLKQNALKHLTQ